jgi:CDP-paratose 2-epimerase
MSVAIVTGSAGLVGSEAVRHFAAQGMDVVGIDNDMRAVFFGEEASTEWNRLRLMQEVPHYTHLDADIRDTEKMFQVFRERQGSIALVVHCAAQPSHDWAASNPFMDLSVNVNGTSVLLEATRQYAPDAVFIFMSTNKVYGDAPNLLPLVEHETRYEIADTHPYFEHGIPETMSIDQCLHSLFGASKVAADVLVQEYGRYFGMKTVCFRGGCLTGPNHSGTALHGFLAYLMKCTASGAQYNIFGYKAKQVRDNIHSSDLINAFDEFFRAPRVAEVYNMGGGRFSNCSMLEAIQMSEEITGNKLNWTYVEKARTGDHQWWVSDCSRFAEHYPHWKYEYDVRAILEEIYDAIRVRRTTRARNVTAA